MSRCAPSCKGAPATPGNQGGLSGSKRKRGFTLMEMCIVLFIIALLVGMTLPAIQSAFVEQGLRRDAHQFALMVRTAMIQTAEQHRPYVIELNSTSADLHPEGDLAKDANDPVLNPDTAAPPPPPSQMEDVSVTNSFDAPNKLLTPDPDKKDKWMDMPQTTWTFQPGQLCPATRIRMTRGDSWLEMSFSALTGSIENESSYFP